MKKILVIDDDQDIAQLEEILLLKNGFHVKTHYTGLGVCDIITYYHPHLVLLDVHLPYKSGTEVCKEIKELFAALPVIFFSANAKETEVLNECNAKAFISKPFEVSHLVNTIRHHADAQSY